MKNIKTILIAVLSFMLLFSISCKNEDKTGGGSGGVDLDSIPTASGTEATAADLSLYNGKTYTGTVGSGVTRKSYTSNPEGFGEQFIVEGNGSGGQVFVTITNNIINYTGSSFTEPIILKSSGGNSYIASEDIDLDGFRYKSYIQITLNSANTSKITFYLYMGMNGGPITTESGAVYNNGGYKAEYEGTLTEYASAGS